jgi:trans-aconitate 2-methyltransferase
MIEAAMSTRSTEEMKKRVSFKLQTIENFVDDNVAGQKYGVIYANASLQWLPDHSTFLPKLINLAKKDSGIIAIQMPDTHCQPSHELMVTAALR